MNVFSNVNVLQPSQHPNTLLDKHSDCVSIRDRIRVHACEKIMHPQRLPEVFGSPTVLLLLKTPTSFHTVRPKQLEIHNDNEAIHTMAKT
jgi:hypothetical protein